jgi:hypothetical protein
MRPWLPPSRRPPPAPPGEAGELLVFEHRDHDAGVQVPGGTFERCRESPRGGPPGTRREGGVTAVEAVLPVGIRRFQPPDGGRLHRRRFVHVGSNEDRDRWSHAVTAGAVGEALVFDCR